MAADTATANRLKDEFLKVKSALQGKNVSHIEDPLGVDGMVKVEMNNFRATGAGEVILMKENDNGDRRYTRFRTWGPGGMDFVEKASYLVKNNGTTQFFKKRAEPGDQIISISEPEDDDSWVDNFS